MIALGTAHSCALANKKLQCWGYNNSGQIGTNDAEQTPIHYTPQTVEIDNETPTKIFTGGNQSCAITESKHVYCWGAHPAIADPLIDHSFVTSPQKLEQLAEGDLRLIYPTELALTGGHSCVRFNWENGTIRCWGNNYFGQLGNNSTTTSKKPVNAQGIQAALQVTAGNDFSCTLQEDESVLCWGSNSRGQLAQSITPTNKFQIPIRLNTLPNVQNIKAGWLHACALLQDKTIQCWGLNNNGQLGDESTTNRYQPTSPKTPLKNVKQLALGNGFTCALLESGQVYCAGNNDNGQLGFTPGTPKTSDTFIQHPHLTNVHQITAGSNHLCAVHNKNVLSCWGLNDQGQLGDDGTENQYKPVNVSLDN